MKCSQCRKENRELNTLWERTKNWIFHHLFPQDVIDLSQDKYTQGFSDGYTRGVIQGRAMRKLYIESDSIAEMDSMIN